MRFTEGGSIQVCNYTGKYPHHNELDSWLVQTKKEAYESIERNKKKDMEKGWQIYNYRIVDLMNRFKPILIEQ